jgi:hypothetical protein
MVENASTENPTLLLLVQLALLDGADAELIGLSK